MAKKTSLPAIVSALPNDVRNFLQRVREMMDGFITTDALVSGGVITVTDGGVVVPPGSDFTPPPAPTGLEATGTITSIMLSWDSTEDYSNFSYMEIWRSGEDNIGTAVLSGQENFNFYVDTVEPESSYYYWIRIVSRANVAGPFNALSGTHGTTSADPTALLALLSGEITASELHASLGERINLIDGSASTPGTIPYQLSLVQSQLDDLQAIQEYDSGTTYVIGDTVKYNNFLYTPKQTTLGNLPTNTEFWTQIGDYSSYGDALSALSSEVGTVASNLSAETTARTTLASQVRGTYTGTNVASVTSGLLFSERTARATADSALSSSVSSLTALVNSNVAAISEEQTARANADSALASSVATIQASANSNTAAIQTEQTARAGGDAANASAIMTVQSRIDTAGSQPVLLSSTGSINQSSIPLNTPDAPYSLTFTSANAGSVLVYIDAYDLEGGLLVRLNNGSYVSAGHQANFGYPDSSRVWFNIYFDNLVAGVNSLDFYRVSPEGYQIYRIMAIGTPASLNGYGTVATGLGFDAALQDNTAAIQTEATTRASQTGDLYAQYTVKLDVGGAVSGYGLASTGPTGTGSVFEVRADKIAFAAPYGVSGDSCVPFVVDTISNRVAMDGAYMKTATIGTAAIGDLAVTDAKMVSLQVGKLTSGDFTGKYINLGTGGNIRSGQTAFNTGTGFWMGKGTDGYARFSVGSSTASGLDYDQAAGTLNIRGKISVKDNSEVGGSTTIITGGSVESGQSSFNVGTGFWIGKGTDGYARFSVGNPTASGIDYSQSTGVLNIRGKVNMYSGSYINGVAANNIASWADSTDTTQINGGCIKTRTVEADSLKAKSITAASGVIGDLAVDTLQIAGRAVTIPTAAFSNTAVITGTTFLTILSITISTTGSQPVIIWFSVIADSNNTGALDYASYIVQKDGATILTVPVANVLAGSRQLTTYCHVDTPWQGTHTYTLRMASGYAARSIRSTQRSMICFEAKR